MFTAGQKKDTNKTLEDRDPALTKTQKLPRTSNQTNKSKIYEIVNWLSKRTLIQAEKALQGSNKTATSFFSGNGWNTEEVEIAFIKFLYPESDSSKRN